MIREIVAFDWDQPVTPQDRDAILENLASQIVRRGLQVPSLWMLEIHRPLMPLCGQIAIGLGPVLGTFFADGAYDLRKYTKLMREPGTVEELIRTIERKSEEHRLAAR
jgi:hypothetical protein